MVLRTPEKLVLPAAGLESEAVGSRSAVQRSTFDRPIAPGGYHWHYVDAVSDDGAFGIVVIALVGNPFSPAYARARATEGAPSALRFCAMNVAIYGPRGGAWALTERAIDAGDRRADAIAIGRSSARYASQDGDLLLDLDEKTSPFPSPVPGRIRGRVRLRRESGAAGPFTLDAKGEHRWVPVAPIATVEVDLDEPDVRFRGHGYHDVNHGDGPLDEAFSRWCWSRARVGSRDPSALLTYDAVRRDGSEESIAIRVDARGTTALGGTAMHALPRTAWRLARSARADATLAPVVTRELEDTPFYARALVKTRFEGHETVAMHEELSADRLRAGWVRFLLGFRMGRG